MSGHHAKCPRAVDPHAELVHPDCARCCPKGINYDWYSILVVGGGGVRSYAWKDAPIELRKQVMGD